MDAFRLGVSDWLPLSIIWNQDPLATITNITVSKDTFSGVFSAAGSNRRKRIYIAWINAINKQSYLSKQTERFEQIVVCL
jgi:hypothetical protein